MNKKIKRVYRGLCLIGMGISFLAAQQDTQILYSINMPGNPFQQPYYQIMVKADYKNYLYSFNSTNQPQFYTFNTCSNEVGCGSNWDSQLNVTSDYVSLYADSFGNPYHTSIIYGLSPYTFRGYTEGAASTLYMQRPAQVQLPFNPLAPIQAQNGEAPVYINATLPDYSDVFLAQTAASLYTSLECATPVYSLAQGQIVMNPCTFTATNNSMPSWYTYIPRDSWWRGSSVIFYGTMASLARANQPQTSFSPYDEGYAWSTRIALGVSPMLSTYSGSGSTGWILPRGVFSAGGWLASFANNSSSFAWNFPLIFAPVVSPGYAGDSQQLSKFDGYNNPTNPVKTVLAGGDLNGNYSVLNTSNPYIPSGNPVTTYDGISLNNGMSYFQLFAQNMQWFSLPAPQSTPLPPFSSSIPQNVTPGQGIFSDAIQLAAMEAPAAISNIPVFTGSFGVTAGITGPVTLIGAAPLTAVSAGSNATNFAVPQAFLSELTANSFSVGHYLQVPLATQGNGTWSGGLVQAAAENPLQYYQGTTPLESKLMLMPYLPIYVADPGVELWAPGGSYCPLSLFNQTTNAQLCYDTQTSPMTNFYSALNGTR